MRSVILTSCLDFYEKDENGNKIVHHFGNANGILNCLKSNIKKYDNFLFVARGNDDENTEQYFNNACKSFELTLPFKNYNILNYSTYKNAKELVEQADLIFLCGGHLPTQNKFFNEINLKELIKNTNALIVGGSAGSMNCANVVYCPPEVEGESLDPTFNRFMKGLGLTDINILPHYDEFKDYVLDNKKYIEEIILPFSHETPVIALNNGSYIKIENNKSIVCGESYIIKDNEIKQICKDGECIELSNI